jgi:hypothetical protein
MRVLANEEQATGSTPVYKLPVIWFPKPVWQKINVIHPERNFLELQMIMVSIATGKHPTK